MDRNKYAGLDRAIDHRYSVPSVFATAYTFLFLLLFFLFLFLFDARRSPSRRTNEPTLRLVTRDSLSGWTRGAELAPTTREHRPAESPAVTVNLHTASFPRGRCDLSKSPLARLITSQTWRTGAFSNGRGSSVLILKRSNQPSPSSRVSITFFRRARYYAARKRVA